MNNSHDAPPAQTYQDYFGPAIFEPLARVVFDHTAPAPGSRVLDLACGTGIATRRAASHVGASGRVVGVDINPAMIEVARTVPVPAGARIEWRQGDAGEIDLPDRAFDLVYCQQGLQFFADRRAGLATMRRLLVDGGCAVLAVWQGLDVHPLFEAHARINLPHLADLGTEVGWDEATAPFSLGDADELHTLLTDAGFRDVDIVARSIEARFAAPERFVERLEFAYAAVVPQFIRNPDAFAAFVDTVAREMKPIVEPYRHGEWLVVPMHTHIALAHA